MNSSIRDLLDDAVAGVEPSTADPVTAVRLRGRRQNRQRLTVTAAAVGVLALAGSLVATLRPAAGPDVAAPAGITAPYLSDNLIVAGSVRFEVPAGWFVITGDSREQCGPDIRAKTISLITADNRGCQNTEIVIQPHTEPGLMLARVLDGIGTPDPVRATPAPITLPGGEPGWMMEPLDSSDVNARYGNIIVFPWSRIQIVLHEDAHVEKAAIGKMVSTGVRNGTLALPDQPATATLDSPDASGRNTRAGHRQTGDPATIAALVGLLRAQKSVSGPGCSTPDQHTARIVLDHTSVVISVGKTCQEAVSSDGGRVRISDATYGRVKQIFGIGAR